MIKNNHLISIIIPIYSIFEYLKRCLDSILQQSYSNIEIVVVDDGSIDDSGVFLDELAKYNSIIVCHIQNQGVTNARLNGVKLANGEYIGFVDGDDVVETNMYSCLMDNINKYHVDISHCGYQMIFNDRTLYLHNTGVIEKHDNLTALKELLSGKRVEPGLCNKLFHKYLFSDLFLKDQMDLSIRGNEDLLMNFYLFSKSNESVYYDKCFYHYMVREESSSKKRYITNQMLNDPIRVQKILLQDTKDQPELQKIVYGRLAALYSNGVELTLDAQPELASSHRRMCRHELFKILPIIVTCGCDFTSVIHSLLAAFCPSLCRFVHTMYAKKKGNYRRFDL